MKRLAVLLCLFLLTGCGKADQPEDWLYSKEIRSTTDGIYLTLEERLADADEIVVATYRKTVVGDYYDEHIFAVKETLYGESQEKITLRESPTVFADGGEKNVTYQNGELEYERGKEYILVLYRRGIPFTEGYCHTLMGELYLPVHDLAAATVYGEAIAEHAGEGLDLSGKEAVCRYLLQYAGLQE